MAIEGQLRDVSLADICQLLAMGGKTGCLTVTDRSNFGYVHFDNGRVIYATVLNRPDRLGELLVRNDVIDRAELSAAMEIQAHQPGKRLGRILVERGSLTEEELTRFISVQIEEAVYHLFAWTEGSFHFDPGQTPDQDPSHLVSINAESLLLEGARRVDEMSVIEKKIPSTDLIFEVERRPTDSDDVEITPEQGKVLELLDGVRTVDDVIRESGLMEFDVVKATYGLLQAGFVGEVGQRETDGRNEEESAQQQHLNLGHAFYRAGMLEDAEREYSAALAGNPAQPAARSRLALIALKSGRPAEALEHIDQVDGTTDVTLLRNRALALEQLGRYGEALEVLERVTGMGVDDSDLHLARGIALLKERRPEEALEAFRAYRDAPDRPEDPDAIYFAYALLAAASAGDSDEALRLGREGLTLHPGNGPVLVNLGVVLERRGETDAAEALYLRAVREPPTPAQAHKNLGDMAYRRGDQAGARAHYERAVKLNPDLGDDLYLKLGNLAYKEGDRDWALELWRKALELNPGNEVVRTNLELVSAAPGN